MRPMMFQSLFFWMCFLRCKACPACALQQGVSILVLLDVLPPGRPADQCSHRGQCFNPCSSGCASSGAIRVEPVRVVILVSILVLLDVLPPGRMVGRNGR